MQQACSSIGKAPLRLRDTFFFSKAKMVQKLLMKNMLSIWLYSCLFIMRSMHVWISWAASGRKLNFQWYTKFWVVKFHAHKRWSQPKNLARKSEDPPSLSPIPNHDLSISASSLRRHNSSPQLVPIFELLNLIGIVCNTWLMITSYCNMSNTS